MTQIVAPGGSQLEFKPGGNLALLSFFIIVALVLGRVSAWFASV